MYSEEEKRRLCHSPSALGKELLHVASKAKPANLIKARSLLSWGADVDFSSYGSSPLSLAVDSEFPQMVRLLLSNGAFLHADILFDAVQMSIARDLRVMDGIVRILVSEGAPLDFCDYHRGETVLHTAAKAGRADFVRLFVSSGADINVTDKNENTALHIAAGSGMLDIVVYLVHAGAWTNCKNIAGKTPLDLAVEKRHRSVEAFLRGAFTCSETSPAPAPAPSSAPAPAPAPKTASTTVKTPAKDQTELGSWRVTDPYKALCGYTGKGPGELSFKEGDVIFVQKKEGTNWEGVLNGMRGVFPSHYVAKL